MFMLQDVLPNKVIYSEFPATNSEMNNEREHRHKLLFVVMVKYSGRLGGVQMPVVQSVESEAVRLAQASFCSRPTPNPEASI